MIISVIINFFLNLALIPKLGALGACIATVITAVIIFLIQFVYINKKMGRMYLFESLVKMSVPVVMLFGVLFLLREWAWTISVLSALFVYSVFLYLGNAMNWKEIEILRGKIE